MARSTRLVMLNTSYIFIHIYFLGSETLPANEAVVELFTYYITLYYLIVPKTAIWSRRHIYIHTQNEPRAFLAQILKTKIEVFSVCERAFKNVRFRFRDKSCSVSTSNRSRFRDESFSDSTSNRFRFLIP